MNIVPLVPAKIAAGWKFQRRKPSRAPASTKHRTAISGWPNVSTLMIPIVAAAISAMPDDRPSRPSMKLIALIIPRIQKTVKATPIAPVSLMSGLPPTGLVTEPTVIPSATAQPASTSCPASCHRARTWRRSSIRPSSAAATPPARSAMSCGPSRVGGIGITCCRSLRKRTARATGTNAATIAIPPPRATGRTFTRRSSGSSTISRRIATRRTSGVTSRATTAANRKPTTAYGSAAPRSSTTLTSRPACKRPVAACGSRLGQARYGEPCADRGHVGRETALLDGLVAGSDRVDDQARDRPHLPRAEATRRGRRRADPDAGRRIGWQLIEGDRVLVDRDPDLVEEVLRLLARHSERGDVDEHQVVVRPAGNEPRALPGEGLCKHPGVLDRAPLVGAELVARGEQERHGLGRDDVHERAALDAREDGLVDRLRERPLDGRKARPVDRVG